MKIKSTYLILLTTLTVLIVAFSGCKSKVEEKHSPPAVEKKTENKEQIPPFGPHKAVDIRRWVEKAIKDADPELLKKAEAVEGKYTAGEIVAGMAIRPKPDYWDNLSRESKIKTISIMNTSLSQARIEAGFAEESDKLNSNLYLEEEDGQIIAVSEPVRGAHLFTTN